MRGKVEGDDDTLPGEEDMDQPAEQRLQSDADNGDHINTKNKGEGSSPLCPSLPWLVLHGRDGPAAVMPGTAEQALSFAHDGLW